jgi:hypothetical protein
MLTLNGTLGITEIVGDLLELAGGLILAKEAWDKPENLVDRNSLERLMKHGPLVQDVPIACARDIDKLFALRSSRMAKIGFFLLACGLILKAAYHSFLFFR